MNVAEELETSPDLTFLSNSLKFPLKDSVTQQILPPFEDIALHLDKLLQSGKNVVVHCYAGRSRSASLMIYDVITRKKMSLAESLELVIKARPQIMPSIGFIEQLIEFEMQTNGFRSLDMHAYVTNLMIQSNRLDLLHKIDACDEDRSFIQLVKDSGIFFIE